MTIEFHDFLNPAQTVDVKRQLDRFEDLGFDCVVAAVDTTAMFGSSSGGPGAQFWN